MKKITLGPQTLVYPMPAFLIGANVGEKPSFMTAAWSGIAASTPPMITLALQHHRYTLKGIRENGVFSVNVPNAELVRETDYCGLVSGTTKADKVKDCNFTIFYGKLKNAPLIEQCPVNLECKVVHILTLGSHTLMIGQIEEVHVSADCMTDGQPDPAKIDPLMYITGANKAYFRIGEKIGPAFKIGLEISKSKS
ncbi:MAG TPA: flavin reductase family protein [Deltaproteobacteria bacterium]|jgi:flavin reductase (DIM6/NTAB) family NADH-FMN oxidoreductase RutF|nr:flavin reductase family protein [Deltaproteobacteria bacterium]HIJ77255.1 flavin reductase family protein [Deltaproteobacteria bacterium]